jgi:hypothetical protein
MKVFRPIPLFYKRSRREKSNPMKLLPLRSRLPRRSPGEENFATPFAGAPQKSNAI